MASAILEKINARGNDYVLVAGSFKGGTTAVTKLEGTGWTVAYTSTGIYTVTFLDTYPSVVSVMTSLSADTPSGVKGYTVAADTIGSTGIWPMSIYDAQATPTLGDLTTTQYVNFLVVFRNSTLEV